MASREVLDKATLGCRLLLRLFALGTNMGIRQMAVTGEHGENESTLRHCTDAQIEADYTDTHGASLGFTFTDLLGYKLLPRLKNIDAIQLYAPRPTRPPGPSWRRS